MPLKKKRKILVDEFVVRLKDKQTLIMNDLQLLEVSNVKFVQQNNLQMRYIYDIVESILGCNITLSRMPKGKDSSDEDTQWRKVSTVEGIIGVYLIDCDYKGDQTHFY